VEERIVVAVAVGAADVVVVKEDTVVAAVKEGIVAVVEVLGVAAAEVV